MRLIDADELNEYIGRESLDTREKIFALVDRMPTLPNPCGKPCAFGQSHGEWIHRRIIAKDRSFDMVVCSNCQTEFSYDAETGVSMDNYKFCPNCGSDNRPRGTEK